MIHMSVAGTSHAKMEIYEVYQQLSCISAHVRSCFGSSQARSGEMPSQADDSHSLEFELHVANVWPMYTSLIADAFHRKTEVVCVHMLHKPCILFRVLCLLGSESG